MKTQIIYTITLVNSDGSKASSSTPALEYPETPSAMLAGNAKQTVEDLARSHTAMTQAIKQAMKKQTNGHAIANTPAGKSTAAGQR